MRLGVVTGKGHAAMIYKRFGKWWGRFSLFDLLLVNFLTLVTEFAAIALATKQMGISPYWSVPLAGIALVIHVISGGYKRWERVTCVLCLIDIVWIVMAFASHTSAAEIARNVLVPSVPAGGSRQVWCSWSLRSSARPSPRGSCFSNIVRVSSGSAAPTYNCLGPGIGRHHFAFGDYLSANNAERSSTPWRSMGEPALEQLDQLDHYCRSFLFIVHPGCTGDGTISIS